MTLENLLERASKAYYEGSPIMEDWEFDALSSRSQINRVGYKTKGGVKHMHRLYSLQKIFVGEKPPIANAHLIESPKLDGACISLLYKEGYLAQALTRGDGIEGVDITDKIFSSDIVPLFIIYIPPPDTSLSNIAFSSAVINLSIILWYNFFIYASEICAVCSSPKAFKKYVCDFVNFKID